MSKKNNILYQYLLHIWKKKFYLIGFTIICMVIAAALSYSPKPVYTSTALIFTGNAQNDKLSKPLFIQSEYKSMISEDLRNSFSVKILEPFTITLSLTGLDKEKTENELRQAAEQYANDLFARFKRQDNILQKYVAALEEITNIKEEITDEFEETINDNETNEDLREILSKYIQVRILLESGEIALQNELSEPPELMDISTVSSNDNLLRNTLLGGALGFQLMLIILVLWKYIIDARRAQE